MRKLVADFFLIFLTFLLMSSSIISSLLLHDESRIRPNILIDPTHQTAIKNLSDKLDGNPGFSLSYLTWVWLTDTGFPLRFPAIAVPTLRMLSRLQKLGITATYRIYQALDFIVETQWLDLGEAFCVSYEMERYLRDFIQREFSDISHQVEIHFFRNIDPIELSSTIAFLQSHTSEHMQKILGYAVSKWKDPITAYTYAAANIVWNDHHEQDEDTQTIVIGWAKEIPFLSLGKAYEASQGIQRWVIPLIQSTGYIPTYYPQRWEAYMEPSGKIINPTSPTKNAHIAYDLSTL